MFGLYTKPFPPITTDYLTNYQWSNVSDVQKLLIKPRSAIRESWKERQIWYRGHNQGSVGLDDLGRGRSEHVIGREPGGRKLLNCGTFEDVDVLRWPGYNISLNFGSLLKPLCNLHNIMAQAIGLIKIAFWNCKEPFRYALEKVWNPNQLMFTLSRLKTLCSLKSHLYTLVVSVLRLA